MGRTDYDLPDCSWCGLPRVNWRHADPSLNDRHAYTVDPAHLRSSVDPERARQAREAWESIKLDTLARVERAPQGDFIRTRIVIAAMTAAMPKRPWRAIPEDQIAPIPLRTGMRAELEAIRKRIAGYRGPDPTDPVLCSWVTVKTRGEEQAICWVHDAPCPHVTPVA